MLRRRPLTLPYDDQLALLVALLDLDGPPLAAPADPERFADAVVHHRVAGFVSVALERERLVLPDAIAERLAEDVRFATLHAALLRREAATLAPAIEAASGAAPVLLKGAGVTERLYEERRLRTYGDVDLLVPPRSLTAAVGAAVGAGWEAMQEFRPGFSETHGHDVHVRRRVGRRFVDVELHWRPGDDPATESLTHARIAATAEPLRLWETTEVLVPAAAEQLILLATHLCSDRLKRLSWVEDLRRAAVTASEEEWQRSFELAREIGLGWVLHRGLDYPAAHLGLDRPRPVSPSPPVPPPWGPLRAVEELDARAAPHVGRLVRLNGVRARARYLRDVLIPTREGLRGTVGAAEGAGDPAPTWRLATRHARTVLAALVPRRR